MNPPLLLKNLSLLGCKILDLTKVFLGKFDGFELGKTFNEEGGPNCKRMKNFLSIQWCNVNKEEDGEFSPSVF